METQQPPAPPSSHQRKRLTGTRLVGFHHPGTNTLRVRLLNSPPSPLPQRFVSAAPLSLHHSLHIRGSRERPPRAQTRMGECVSVCVCECVRERGDGEVGVVDSRRGSGWPLLPPIVGGGISASHQDFLKAGILLNKKCAWMLGSQTGQGPPEVLSQVCDATEDFSDTPGRWTGQVLGACPGWETGSGDDVASRWCGPGLRTQRPCLCSAQYLSYDGG